MTNEEKYYDKKGNAKVSVVVTSYNHERYVIEALESVREQNYPHLEIIYCDDASQDSSALIAGEWLRSHSIPYQMLINPANIGYCETLNRAISLCRSQYVQMIAADDLLLPGKIVSQVDFLEDQPKYIGVYSDAKLIDDRGNGVVPYLFSARFPFRADNSSDLLESLLANHCIPGTSVLFRREIFDLVGKFDTQYVLEDYPYFLRIAQKYQLYCLPEPGIAWRLHAENTSKKLEQSYRRHAEYFWILYDFREHPVAIEHRKRLVLDAYRSRFMPNWSESKLLESMMADRYLLIERYDQHVAEIRHTWSYRLGHAILQPLRYARSIWDRFVFLFFRR